MLPNDRPLKCRTNIGPMIAARFSEVGVSAVGDLRRVGIVKVFQMVKINNPEQTKRKLTREAAALGGTQRPPRSEVARSMA